MLCCVFISTISLFTKQFCGNSMASSVPTVLIFGHSFVKRFNWNLWSNSIPGVDANFNLPGKASVHLHGVGGHTVAKLSNLRVFRSLAPDIIILEIATNNLSIHGPEVVGSAIDDLVQLPQVEFSVRVVAVCHVNWRGQSYPQAPNFNNSAKLLNQYVWVVLEQHPNIFTWRHMGFTNPSPNVMLPDGVHVNSAGQYCLYRSYRGAILKALHMLWILFMLHISVNFCAHNFVSRSSFQFLIISPVVMYFVGELHQWMCLVYIATCSFRFVTRLCCLSVATFCSFFYILYFILRMRLCFSLRWGFVLCLRLCFAVFTHEAMFLM